MWANQLSIFFNSTLSFLLLLWKHIVLPSSYSQLLFFFRDTLSSLVLLSMKFSQINVKQVTQTLWPIISSSVKFENAKQSSVFSQLWQSQQVTLVPAQLWLMPACQMFLHAFDIWQCKRDVIRQYDFDFLFLNPYI